jgi:hypothetical protein
MGVRRHASTSTISRDTLSQDLILVFLEVLMASKSASVEQHANDARV